MIWLVLAMLVICLIVVLRNRSHKEVTMQQGNEQHEFLLPSTIVDADVEDEYVIAVITAAIHEFTGSGEFEVVRIKPSAQNWILTGRQNLLANR